MALTVRTRLTSIGLLSLFMILVANFTGFIGIEEVRQALNVATTSSLLMRNHLESDMMHDALRADVLAAILAMNDEEKSASQKDVREHAENFKKKLAIN